MRYKILSIFIFIVLILVIGCTKKRPVNYEIPNTIEAGKVIYAGVRSSNYGIKPFPDPQGWQYAMEKMTDYYKGSTPCAIWIVGRLKRPKSCFLEFPGDSAKYTNISFLDKDKHEEYLTHFDTVGIKVFLQVEPAHANVDTLINVVLSKYKHHPCVIGFGVDVEWYREADNPEWGVKVEDDTAKAWEARVKSHNSNYRLFLKHWDRDWMPKNYRGDIIFVDDSQELEDFEKAVEEFVIYWADYFKPNMIFCQIGYRSDRPWWEKLKTPPKDIGMTIASNIDQDCGIFWVDFTLRDVLPTTKDQIPLNQN
jgi:hypothetical protein